LYIGAGSPARSRLHHFVGGRGKRRGFCRLSVR
jgi:hypothetical protein